MIVATITAAPDVAWHDPAVRPAGATAGAPAESLRQVTDNVAQSLGAWLLVERCGEVLAHAVGPGPCPEPLADAVVRRDTSGLDHRLGRSARAQPRPVLRAADARDGIRVWTTGAAPSAADLERISLACVYDSPPVTNPALAELLQPRGPQRVGSAPPARLVAIPAGAAAGALSREARAVLATRGDVHTEGDWLYLALAPTEPPQPIVATLSQRHGGLINAGVADVPAGATDWTQTGRLARRLAALAAATGQPCASAQSPAMLVRLILDEARAATSTYLTGLGISPLERLTTYDDRADGTLTKTLAAWLAGGCDTAATAQALHMHPNTVRYRIRRVRELTGYDLEDADVQAALRLVLT